MNMVCIVLILYWSINNLHARRLTALWIPLSSIDFPITKPFSSRHWSRWWYQPAHLHVESLFEVCRHSAAKRKLFGWERLWSECRMSKVKRQNRSSNVSMCSFGHLDLVWIWFILSSFLLCDTLFTLSLCMKLYPSLLCVTYFLSCLFVVWIRFEAEIAKVIVYNLENSILPNFLAVANFCWIQPRFYFRCQHSYPRLSLYAKTRWFIQFIYIYIYIYQSRRSVV